jgi:nitrilase
MPAPGSSCFPRRTSRGYPVWIWRLRPENDAQLTSTIFAKLLENSTDLTADGLRPLQEAAAARGVVVVCGVHERQGAFSRATIYNTVVTIGASGRILNRHRKLMPTNPERMVWGQGNASGLRVVDTEVGRVGSLICSENYMPLCPLRALRGGGRDLCRSDVGLGRDLAREHAAHRCGGPLLGHGGRQLATGVRRARVVPGPIGAVPGRRRMAQPGRLGSARPRGQPRRGPLHEEHGMLLAALDSSRAAPAHRTLDVAGHYARSDVFQLTINRAPGKPVHFAD